MLRTCLVVVTLAATSVAAGGTADAHFTSGCKKDACKRHVVQPFKKRLLNIATCESDRRWHIVGRHEGGLQFDPPTWDALGSRYAGAHLAPALEQMYRAVIWASRIGWAWRSTAGWPHCG